MEHAEAIDTGAAERYALGRMSEAELRAKFDDNAGAVLPASARDRLASEIGRTQNLSDASTLVDLSVRRP